MRFTGYFDDGRPFLRILAFYPAISIYGNVEFLVDTGSDGTVLNSTDATRLGINIKKLKYAGKARGVGSATRLNIGAQGGLMLVSDNNKDFKLEQLPKSEVVVGIDYSLLGRDILLRFKLHLEKESVYLED